MIRFVTALTVAVVAVWAAPQPYVLQLDLSPEEAQKYINNPPFNVPQLAPKTAVLPLVKYNDPRFRAADAGPTLGHYWKNGHEIENTNDYVDEVYLARQYHGQDGLGAFAYGYETPESSKVENRARSGDVVGAYTYQDGKGDKINVKYWADNDGFHQEDDRPKELVEPVQETEEVRQARLEHERAWQAAAAAASQQPDPQGEYREGPDFQASGSEPQGVYYNPPQVEQVPREGKAYGGQQGSQLPNYLQQLQNIPQYQKNYQQSVTQSQAPSQPLPNYLQQFQNVPQYQKQYQEPEPTGPPRGFFYDFEYPVDIIRPKSELQAGGYNPGKPIDEDTIAVGSGPSKY